MKPIMQLLQCLTDLQVACVRKTDRTYLALQVLRGLTANPSPLKKPEVAAILSFNL